MVTKLAVDEFQSEVIENDPTYATIPRKEGIIALKGIRDHLEQDTILDDHKKKLLLVKVFFSLSFLQHSFDELVPSNVNSKNCLNLLKEVYEETDPRYQQIKAIIEIRDQEH